MTAEVIELEAPAPAQAPAPVDFLIQAARTNFAAFVSAVHRPRFKHSIFSATVCRAIDRFVADVLAGLRPVLMLTAPPQHGKLFSMDTPILTANRGWTTHGALAVGDVLYRPDGTTTRVIAESAPQSSDMRITFSDGSVLNTHAHHEWLMHRTWLNGRTARVLETQEMLARGLWRGEPGKRGARANFQLPDVQALAGVKTELPIKPYTLGVWLGDGVRTRAVVTVAKPDESILQGIAADGYAETNRNVHKHTGVQHAEFKTIREPLRSLGLLNAGYRTQGGWSPKFIPDAYFGASYAQRLELLAGLIDSDGYVYPVNGRVTISNTEPELVRSIERLIATFGWRVTTTWFDPRTTSSGAVGRERVAQICFQPDCIVPCRLERYRQAFKPGAMKRRRTVTSIERGDFGLGKCIQVEHEDGMYLVGDTLIPTHNSSLISKCLPAYLFGRLTGELPAVRIACASYAETLAARNKRDAVDIMREPIYREIFPHTSLIGFRGVDNTTDTAVPGDGMLRGVGRKGSLTGFSVDIALVDDMVKDADEALSEAVQEANVRWWDSVLGTRLQQRGGIVIIGTPWSAQDLLAHVRKTRGDEANFRRLSFPALNFPEETGYDEALPQGALVPHLHSEEKLREMKKHMALMWWASMFQQRPLADFGAIFKRQYLQLYRRADLAGVRFVQKVMSIDAAFKEGKTSDYVAVGVWGKTDDNRVYLLGFRREQLGFVKTAQAIVDLRSQFKDVHRIYVEEAANGAAVIDMLKKHYPQIVGVPPLGSKEARWHAVSWAWDAGSVLLPHPEESPGIQAWIDEITTVPDAANDDTADCMAIALQQLLLRSPIAALITRDILNRSTN